MLKFDLSKIKLTEFGVGTDDRSTGRTVSLVPVDVDVQKALVGMVERTWNLMQANTTDPQNYEPSEKHGATEHLVLPLADDWAEWLRDLFNAKNLRSSVGVLKSEAGVFCYFARLKDKTGQRLVGVQRANQFKGMLKSPMLRLTSDALALIPDKVFRLDHDFDLLIDNTTVHILRPSGFEFVCRLQAAIMDAVPENILAIGKDLPYIDFGSVESYATKHPRAARYLASIRTQDLTGIDKTRLMSLCKRTSVTVTQAKGRVQVDETNTMAFLEVLDRRRYEVDLLKNGTERFRAASRTKIG